MPRSSAIAVSVVLTAAAATHAQTEFLGLPASGYLDNISDSAAIQRGATYVPLSAMGAMADDQRFLTKRRISLNYAYHDTEFSRTDSEAHTGVGEVYLESRCGQALNLGFHYSSIRNETLIGSVVVDPTIPVAFESESTGFSGQLAQELFRFLCPDLKSSQLWAGVSGGYREDETDPIAFALPATESESFFVSPNLVFAQGITDRMTALLIPAYTIEWTETIFSNVPGFARESEASLFTLTGRADYGVTDRIILTGFATWKREIDKQIDGVPSRFLDCEDWAEFGGSVRFAITEDIGVRAGYSFETFHPVFDQHKFAARLELGF